MRLTKLHREFYVNKKVGFLAELSKPVCIHALINSQVPEEKRASSEPHNTWVMINMKRKRLRGQGLVDSVSELLNSSDPKRKAVAQRVADRLIKELQRRCGIV